MKKNKFLLLALMAIFIVSCSKSKEEEFIEDFEVFVKAIENSNIDDLKRVGDEMVETFGSKMKNLYGIDIEKSEQMIDCVNSSDLKLNDDQKAKVIELQERLVKKKGEIMKEADGRRKERLNKNNVELMKEKGVEEDVAENFIKTMYDNRLYMDDKFLLKHCSPELLNELHEEIDGVDTYEPYLFGVYQDGVSDRHEIVKVKSLGDNWYRYDFYDQGVKGACRIRLVLNPENVITISDLKFIMEDY